MSAALLHGSWKMCLILLVWFCCIHCCI